MLIGILEDLNAWAQTNQDYILKDVLPVLTQEEKPAVIATSPGTLTTPVEPVSTVLPVTPVTQYMKYVKPVLIGAAVFVGILILKNVILKKRRR